MHEENIFLYYYAVDKAQLDDQFFMRIKIFLCAVSFFITGTTKSNDNIYISREINYLKYAKFKFGNVFLFFFSNNIGKLYFTLSM